ncbi:hypothetical protein GUITHDRAFT_122395 [Guillardia theta CCMP2712]|uniref:Uncharacterized protein n=1 Tax=Guillardia theta (strain CCMP2712) TaxID=905079 RepID=L1I5A3_GUITC|nr:hypothetical protein GUITHDRAFT_122395 [Guillardia theta CCMP2712]EKX31406.1 hypothetical protein GUITHDRAFT_122395 [Guillardia theta CCMP2712]|eukprot:XP_005818386.1 hypothetical protein GUITHDRAFT_122395 [Guillardia theta CCMP2712]
MSFFDIRKIVDPDFCPKVMTMPELEESVFELHRNITGIHTIVCGTDYFRNAMIIDKENTIFTCKDILKMFSDFMSWSQDIRKFEKMDKFVLRSLEEVEITFRRVMKYLLGKRKFDHM